MSLPLGVSLGVWLLVQVALLREIWDSVYGYAYPLEVKKDPEGMALHVAKWKYTLRERIYVGRTVALTFGIPLLVAVVSYLFTVGLLTVV